MLIKSALLGVTLKVNATVLPLPVKVSTYTLSVGSVDGFRVQEPYVLL